MKKKSVFARGCLLGMAIGDAMGCTIDDQSWEEIKTNYGPNGLLGFDLQMSEYAPVSSHTQVAAFLCNGLLIALTRAGGDYARWGKLALQEWTRSQQFYQIPHVPPAQLPGCPDAGDPAGIRFWHYGHPHQPE